MSKFEQPAKQKIIFCPKHGRLTNLEEGGYLKDKQGDTHFFHLAYCPACARFYTTYERLTQLTPEPRHNGVPILTVSPLSPHEARRRELAAQEQAVKNQREQQTRIRKERESKADRAAWAEIFDPQEEDFASLFAASCGVPAPKPKAAQAPAAKPQPKAATAKPSPQEAPPAPPAPDPYARAEAASVRTVWLSEGTLNTCPVCRVKLADRVANLTLSTAKPKRLSGRLCPRCGEFFVNRKSFDCLKLDAKTLQTEVLPLDGLNGLAARRRSVILSSVCGSGPDGDGGWGPCAMPEGIAALLREAAGDAGLTALFIASDPDAAEDNDQRLPEKAASLHLSGVPVAQLRSCDGRNADQLPQLLQGVQAVFLCGGHVPTQNRFFRQLQLKAALESYPGLIIGISAGSMNAAARVYCPPELPGEAADPAFPRYLEGLGLTDISVLPHFVPGQTEILDGRDLARDFYIPDSCRHPFICLADGAYILIKQDRALLHGPGWRWDRGILRPLCGADEEIEL